MNAQLRLPVAPPGPRSNWLGFDLLREAKADFIGHIEGLHARFGDVVRSQVFNETIYDIHHPDLIRALLVDNADGLVRWERGIEVFAGIHGQSVLVTEGEIWKRQRRMLQPGFSAKRMTGYCALMDSATETALQALPASDEIEVEFESWAHKLTMDVILQTLFSRGAPTIRDRAVDAVATLSRVGMAEMFWPMSAPDWMPQKTAKRRAKRVLDTLIHSNITERRTGLPLGGAVATDVLGMLLSIRDEAGDGIGLSEEEVRDQCMTIFLAGHETTALAMTWWAWLMAQHPQVVLQAQSEIDLALTGNAPRYDNLRQLPYLVTTLKEALRLYPPAPTLITRRTTREVAIGEWIVPKGAMVRVTPWVVHRDARWFPEPALFKPERFNEETPSTYRNSFMPFGTGPRACLGAHFALTEMTLIAAKLLQRYSFRSNAAPTPKLDVLLFLEGGMPITLIRRIAMRSADRHCESNA
jgi:cytochrome P450